MKEKKEKKIDERPWKTKHYLVTWTLKGECLSLQLTSAIANCSLQYHILVTNSITSSQPFISLFHSVMKLKPPDIQLLVRKMWHKIRPIP